MSESLTKYRLSKSKIAAFEHCPRRLWLQVHRRHVGQFDPETLARFQFGHEVGHKALLAHPDGIMVDAVPDMQAAIDRTAQLLAMAQPKPIFEATFLHDNVLCRVDILDPDGEGGWRAIEVKASPRVKPYQLADIATQVWIMRSCGVTISQAVIRHLESAPDWRWPDIAAVRFQDADVTRSMRRQLARRPNVATDASVSIRGAEVFRDTGEHCHKPFACEFRRYCALAQTAPLLARIA
ncbi:hypothetical protein [Sphingomonas crocodyli]|uniref:PD-(D/E)XK nuclease family protein n=1 Tax=Sphingomonas crocodyli TaxID=1979270 RepID=A0A437M5E9_9SPHN|nr:hypothetical protein [Sphingomonas crocodyli]RVT92907.1 hypothetical protein EOD43_03070 [Sphingomonas crocodyli]